MAVLALVAEVPAVLGTECAGWPFGATVLGAAAAMGSRAADGARRTASTGTATGTRRFWSGLERCSTRRFPVGGPAGTGCTLGIAHWAAGLLGGAEVLVPAGGMRPVGEYLRRQHEGNSERRAIQLSWLVLMLRLYVCRCSLALVFFCVYVCYTHDFWYHR